MKEKFIQYFRQYIKRDGAEDLLKYLEKTDFFMAPASTKYHMAREGGLCEHSINVFERLCSICEAEILNGNTVFTNIKPDGNTEMESIAICGLLHDLCKCNCYKPGTRNVKNEVTGQWEKVPTYSFDDQLPYGHGEKSVYIISSFIKLTREEAMAIRWHMGYSDADGVQRVTLNNAYNMFPLAFLTHIADEMATFINEKDSDKAF